MERGKLGVSCARIAGTLAALALDYAGPNLAWSHGAVFRARAYLRVGVRAAMSSGELVMGLVLAVGLTAYLVYALLRPEKF